MSDCCSRAIELMLRMQDEQNFQSMYQLGVRLEIGLVEFIKHIEETLDIGCILRRIVVLSANSMAESIGSNRRHSS